MWKGMGGVALDSFYLAVDIGASGGRLVLGNLDENGLLTAGEIHRFHNGAVNRGGYLCWEYDRLFTEILEGMRKCAAVGKVPVSMGVDTWGVDFVLLDRHGFIIGDTVAYRDSRTQGADIQIAARVPEPELYMRTGIQKQMFNTIYQLWAVREQLACADTFLMAPDYFHYLLTGAATNEYTEASTTGLLSAAQKTWDAELLDELGYPRRLKAGPET
jgi:rhamnulokinase